MMLSAMQMQPRSAVGVDSWVKQTMFVARQGMPRRLIAPESTGTTAVERPCGLHGPPCNPAGMTGGGRQLQLAKGAPGTGQMQVLAPIWSMPQVTQQSSVQGRPQLTLWQSAAHAPPGAKSGLTCGG